MNILKVLKSRSLLFYVVLLLSLFLIGEVGATTYYVSWNGNDKNSGSTSAPFITIQKAADIVNAGDTVYVRAGTYGGFQIHQKNGASSAWIVFKPYPGETVTIDVYANNYSSSFHSIDVAASSYIEINGFKITNSDPKCDSQVFAEYSQMYGRDGIKVDVINGVYSSYIKIYNNTIYHIGSHGILSTPESSHVEIIGNTIYNTGLSHRGYCMYLEGTHYTVAKNIMHNCYGHALHIYSGYSQQPQYFIVEKNKIYNTGHTNYGAGFEEYGPDGKINGDGILLWGTDSTVQNNIVYGNIGDGLDIRQSRNKVYNNTIYNNNGKGLYISVGGNMQVINNISYLNDGGNFTGTGNLERNNFYTNPNFVDAVNGDFHLKAGSPVIDAGDNISSVVDDYWGTLRPTGTKYDIGAYEYQSSVSDTMPPAPPSPIEVK